MITMPYWEIISGNYFMRQGALSCRDVFSVPRIKAFTHGLSRVLFILTYSYFVLFAVGSQALLLKLLLFIWGVSLTLVEALQLRAKSSFQEYITVWNVLDLLLLALLLGGLIMSTFIVPLMPGELLSYEMVHSIHALNLLPCYVRLLQIFELSEYFGTLLFTVMGMAQDTSHFLVLLGIISLGFSCSLTPMLYPSAAARWDKGVSWGFWAIFGDVELESSDKSQSMVLGMYIGFLRYMLSLTSNVLLVNLLIAMLNDTYIANKDASKREWAFNRVDAVLEFSSPEAHILPPPLDVYFSFQKLRGPANPVSRRDQNRYCTITKVVPLGPSDVRIHCVVVGCEAENEDEAVQSMLITEEDEHEPHDWHPGRGGSWTLDFEKVCLRKPLNFRFGREESGYQAVRVQLDQDTWTKPMTRIERRAIQFLQQQVLHEVDIGEERVDEKEAALSEMEQKLGIYHQEVERLKQQVADLTSRIPEQNSEAGVQKKRHDELDKDSRARCVTQNQVDLQRELSSPSLQRELSQASTASQVMLQREHSFASQASTPGQKRDRGVPLRGYAANTQWSEGEET